MRILRITSKGYKNGGVEDGILLLRPVLKSMGHEVKIMTSNFHPELPHFSDFEFEAIENQLSILQLIYRIFYPKPYFELKKILREFQPDIVQIHTISQISPSILFALKDFPVVETVHQAEDFTPDLLTWYFPTNFYKRGRYHQKGLSLLGWIHYFYHRYISKLVYFTAFKNVDAFVSFSKYMQRELRKEGIKSIHVTNATKLFDYMQPTFKSKTLLYVGRLEEQKGVDCLIRSMPTIISVCPKTELLIAGDGPEITNLKNIVDEMNLDEHINFLGYQNRTQLGVLYSKSSLVIMPSLGAEAFGKVGIEAMSVGRPVIASDIGGISDWLIDGQTGYLVFPGDPSAIANKVIKLLSDEALLQDMSVKSRKQAENFTIEFHAEHIIKLYEDVIADFKKRGHVSAWKIK
jgi:glycosyltransferase involved in cell wall biosynthesis